MGKEQRDKGARFEREVVNRFKEAGSPAERVPLSGAAGGSYTGDVIIDGKRCECKVRARAFKELYSWLEGNDILIIKRDRCEPLVIQTLSDFICSREPPRT